MRTAFLRAFFLCLAALCALYVANDVVPTALAYPAGAPAGYTGAPLSAVDFGNCTHCHGGTAKSGGVTVSGFPTGNTYTPGVTQHLTVTVPTTTSGRGFELTARLATSTPTPEGKLTVTDNTNTQLLTSGAVQFIEQTSSGSASNTWSFDWTAPSSSVGDIVFYVAGVAGYSNVYTNSYTLTASAPPPPPLPTLSANPSSLTFSYQSGSATPPSPATFAVSSSDASAINFTAAASGGTWLSVSPTSGTSSTTANTLTLAVNPTGLAPGTYNDTVTISSSGASNKPTVAVTLAVTSSVTLSASPARLTFSPRSNFAPQQVTVSSSGAVVTFTVSTTILTPAGGNWLSASCPTNPCTTPSVVTLPADRTSLTTGGNYYATVTFTPSDPAIAAVTIPVKIRIPKH